MAMKDGQILIVEPDNAQFTMIKSWKKMKWSREKRMFYGPVEIDILNKLAGIIRLPGPIEAERQRLNEIAQAVNTERMKENPEPLYKYPVKFPLFKHQIRACNMCLITFGLILPPGKETKHGSS